MIGCDTKCVTVTVTAIQHVHVEWMLNDDVETDVQVTRMSKKWWQSDMMLMMITMWRLLAVSILVTRPFCHFLNDFRKWRNSVKVASTKLASYLKWNSLYSHSMWALGSGLWSLEFYFNLKTDLLTGCNRSDRSCTLLYSIMYLNKAGKRPTVSKERFQRF